MSRARNAGLALLLGVILIDCCGPAVAAKLDRDTCASLAGELASLKATGLKSDMDRGPEWGLATMSAERLQSVQRLMEIEDQLEFRCGARGLNKSKERPELPVQRPPSVDARAADKPPAPVSPTAPATKGPAESGPAPATRTAPVTTSPSKAASVSAPTVATGPAAAKPAVTKTIVPTPTTTPPAAAKAASVGTTTSPVGPTKPPPSAPALAPGKAAKATPTVVDKPLAPAVASGQALQTGTTGPAMSAEAATPPISPAAQVRKKRRSPASAYVSPGDVSPYFLPGMR